MTWFLVFVLVVAAAMFVGRIVVSTPPADLARRLRQAGAMLLILAGGGLLIARQFAIGLPLLFSGAVALRRIGFGRPKAPVHQQSSVRSAGLDMVLDHDTGAMDGLVLAGRYEGKKLSGLSLEQLLEVAVDFRGDAESLRLLEGHLDRAHPGWRDDIKDDGAGRTGPAPRPGGMSTQEAYQILGLEAGAGETEVREAHRRLMKQVHPDRGGSAALAAQINEAKDRILGRHR